MDEMASAYKRDLLLDFALLLSVTAFFVILTAYVGYLRYTNFYTSDWDFGIMQQMLWSTVHGKLLFETADLSTSGYTTYLEVNSAYVAIPVAYIYSLGEGAFSLLLIQSFAVGLSSFPVYLISRNSAMSRAEAVLFAVLFLFSMAVLSSIFYDYHWEAFIPAEFLFFYYLMSVRRYRWALIPFAIGSLTLEVFPLLAGAVSIYFISEGIFPLTGKEWMEKNRQFLLFLVLSGVTFVIIESVRVLVIERIFGLLSSSFASSLGAYFISPSIAPVTLARSLIYWLVLLLTLSFLPLLRPRSLIMSIPWFVESVFLYSKFSQNFGYQYGFIALPPMFVSAVMGYRELKERGVLPFLLLPLSFLALSVIFYSRDLSMAILKPEDLMPVLLSLISAAILFLLLSSGVAVKRRRPGLKLSAPRTAWLRALSILFLTSLVIFNLVAGPLNTQNFSANIGFNVSYSQNPDFPAVQEMARMIPANSYVLASDNLFPLVDQNLHAYSAMWLPFNSSYMPFLPFNSTHLPEYVFADSSEMQLLPPFVLSVLHDAAVYGVVAYLPASRYPGDVYLFKLGYSSPPVVLSP
jgi:uncharacterized membrane protein